MTIESFADLDGVNYDQLQPVPNHVRAAWACDTLIERYGVDEAFARVCDLMPHAKQPETLARLWHMRDRLTLAEVGDDFIVSYRPNPLVVRERDLVLRIREACAQAFDLPTDYPFFHTDYWLGETSNEALLRLYRDEWQAQLDRMIQPSFTNVTNALIYG